MKKNRFLAGIAWALTVTVLLCLPGSALPKNAFLAAIHADKWVHIALFAIGCCLFCWPFLESGLPAKQKIARFYLIALAGIMYGIGMEFVQKYWVANRSFELADIFADSAGCTIGCIICLLRVKGKG